MRQRDIGSRMNLWIVLSLSGLIIFLGIGNYYGILADLHFYLGPYFFHHWLAWLGSAYIAFFVPVLRWVRATDPRRYRNLLPYHIYGNLISVAFITMHFSQQMARPPQFAPDLGTGVVLYASMFLLVATGILLQFRFFKARRSWWRYLHTGVTTTFYLIIVVHILQGVGVI